MMVVLMSLHDGLPAQEFWRSARQRMARIRAQVRQRRVRVIRFESDQWVELEFFRDDGTRDRAVFQHSAWTGWTPEVQANFNAGQRNGPQTVAGPLHPPKVRE